MSPTCLKLNTVIYDKSNACFNSTYSKEKRRMWHQTYIIWYKYKKYTGWTKSNKGANLYLGSNSGPLGLTTNILPLSISLKSSLWSIDLWTIRCYVYVRNNVFHKNQMLSCSSFCAAWHWSFPCWWFQNRKSQHLKNVK